MRKVILNYQVKVDVNREIEISEEDYMNLRGNGDFLFEYERKLMMEESNCLDESIELDGYAY